MLPHNLRRRIAINGTVEDSRLPVNPVLIVGLHDEPRRNYMGRKSECSIHTI